PRSRRTGEDHHTVGLLDGPLEPPLGLLVKAQVVQVGDDISVVQHTDDDALQTQIVVDPGQWDHRHAESDERTVNPALDEAVLSTVAFEAVDTARVVFDDGQKSLRMDALLQMPVRQTPVYSKRDLDAPLRCRDDVDVRCALPYSLHEGGFKQVDESRTRYFGFERRFVDLPLRFLERRAEIDRHRLLPDAFEILVALRKRDLLKRAYELFRRVTKLVMLEPECPQKTPRLNPGGIVRNEDPLLL